MTTTERLRRSLSQHYRGLLAVLVIALIEVFVFNLGFWTSLGKPTSLTPASESLSIGKGLSPTKIEDVYTLTDPDKGYVDVDLNAAQPHAGSVDLTSLQLIPTAAQPADRTDLSDARYNPEAPDFSKTVNVRIQAQASQSHSSAASPWITIGSLHYSPAAASSTYARLDMSGAKGATSVTKIRIWFLQPEQSSFAYAGVRINERPTFSINVARLAVLALVALSILAFRPGSRLFRTRLNTASRGQRGTLLAAMIPLGLVFVASALAQMGYKPLSVWNTNGDYTYDFDQYSRLATSILHGTPWLDLPVPQALADAANPYSTQVRSQLLSGGVTPIFWDHAFYNGHWYCYFGALPAVVLYLPFQALTSLWVPGGIAVSTSAIVVLLLVLLALTGTLMSVRFIARYFPQTSLGMAILCVGGFLCGANLFFLSFRLNFYAVPMLSSLVLTTLGLWLWMGSRLVRDDGGLRISRWRVSLGFLCIAANLGCRPTFVLAALLAFPLFWPEIRAGAFFSYFNPRAWKNRRSPASTETLTTVPPSRQATTLRPLSSLKNDLAALLPAALICVPILGYNFWRFGSFLNFGNDYQLTVTDLTTYKEPVKLIAPITYYYLFQPPHFTTSFPFLGLTQTPLSSWQLTEPHAGGFFWLVPFALLGIVAVFMRKRAQQHHAYGVIVTSLVMATGLCVFDAYKAGLSWRYMADFGWCVALAAIAGACMLEAWGREKSRPDALGSHRLPDVALVSVRVAVAVLVGVSLILAALTFVMPGRIDSLQTNAPQLFYDLRGWFTGWAQWA
ncbi:MAG: hypothetical protein LKI93_05120 [Bifidobacteriaceae bacterium]|nr:hypothetical protein [Bifidobacteriaceae bacterium]MCI1915297.1 hypothetical protein [Bifidobacteriaceae bacterium]